MTLLERDILTVLLALNTVGMILFLPYVVPIQFDWGSLFLFTVLIGLPIGLLGVWLNHRAAALERLKPRGDSQPPQRK